MSSIRSGIETLPDLVTTAALAVSVVLLLVLFADLLDLPPDTEGLWPHATLAKAAVFAGLLSMPVMCCMIAWPIHLRQRRRGERVFVWLRCGVLASSAWMGPVFHGISNL